MNFYAVLGISRNADEEAIRGAYRMLARRYHPDRGAGSCPEKFREVHEAYKTLIDGRSRHAYDLSLRGGQVPKLSHGEPIVRQSETFCQEDPGVFGRFESASQGTAFQPASIDVPLDTWFGSLNDRFVWRWP